MLTSLRTITMGVLAIALLSSCATPAVSSRSVSSSSVMTGEFNVMLYGMETANDVESVVILDSTADDYTIISQKTLEEYRISRNVPAIEALDKAQAFLAKSTILTQVERREIIGPDGKLLGYELRPLFNNFQVDNSYFNCWYILKDHTVTFHVRWNEFYKPFSGQERR